LLNPFVERKFLPHQRQLRKELFDLAVKNKNNANNRGEEIIIRGGWGRYEEDGSKKFDFHFVR
jgi:hypothetical protein